MNRVVWTTIGIEADLTERTWANLSQQHSEEIRKITTHVIDGISSSDVVALLTGRTAPNPPGDKTQPVELTLSEPVTTLRFEFDTETQAIAFRLTHPDHLIDEPTDPEPEKAARVNRLNRLPRLEASQ